MTTATQRGRYRLCSFSVRTCSSPAFCCGAAMLPPLVTTLLKRKLKYFYVKNTVGFIKIGFLFVY